jgi:hypothetical protein
MGGGRAYPFCITERKFKTILGKIWLGLKDMVWLGNTIEKAASKDTVGDFFRHHRDGYKAIHVIRRSNQNGQYLEISEFHSGSRQGVLRIPTGVARKGWLQLATLCKGIQTKHTASNVHRGVVAGAGVREKEVAGTKPNITHRNRKFQNSVTDAMKKAVGSISVNMPKDKVNARVTLNLNLELSCGPEGEWVISRAEVQKQEPMWFEINKPGQQHVGSSSRPTSRQVWRPKAQQANPSNSLTTANTRVLNTETVALPEEKLREPETHVMTHEGSDRAEGSWALQLRQGQRIFVPELPPLPLSPNPFYALSSTVLEMEPREQNGIPATWALEEFEHTSSMAEAPMEHTGTPATWALESFERTSSMAESELHSSTCGDGSEWEEHADWVEPLAVEYPGLEATGVPEIQVDTVQPGNPKVISGPQSDWVTEKMQEFGVVLGASYEGFEDRVLALLCAIEAESRPMKSGVVSGKEKPRVPRELRNLISNVNYEGGSTRRTTSVSGRALTLC